MKFDADKFHDFDKLVPVLAAEEQEHYPYDVPGVCEAIGRELAVLRMVDDMIAPDCDLYLEALVRIAAIVRCHAVGHELAYAEGVAP